jgi:hypothetical protein
MDYVENYLHIRNTRFKMTDLEQQQDLEYLKMLEMVETYSRALVVTEAVTGIAIPRIQKDFIVWSLTAGGHNVSH